MYPTLLTRFPFGPLSQRDTESAFSNGVPWPMLLDSPGGSSAPLASAAAGPEGTEADTNSRITTGRWFPSLRIATDSSDARILVSASEDKGKGTRIKVAPRAASRAT